MESTAQFDFIARSNRELSLRKGDMVTLRKQVSNDWWQGTVKGKDVKNQVSRVLFVCVNSSPLTFQSIPLPRPLRDEDRDKCSDHLKSSSSEESVRKGRPSGNLSLHSQLSVFHQNSISTAEHSEHGDGDSSATAAPKPPPSITSSSRPIWQQPLRPVVMRHMAADVC